MKKSNHLLTMHYYLFRSVLPDRIYSFDLYVQGGTYFDLLSLFLHFYFLFLAIPPSPLCGQSARALQS